MPVTYEKGKSNTDNSYIMQTKVIMICGLAFQLGKIFTKGK